MDTTMMVEEEATQLDVVVTMVDLDWSILLTLISVGLTVGVSVWLCVAWFRGVAVFSCSCRRHAGHRRLSNDV